MDTERSGQAVVLPPRQERSRRPLRVGTVTSAARDKTIKVMFSYLVKHAKYGKYLRREIVLHAHDERNEAGEGDIVELAECRPMSRTKHWRLVRIVEKSARQAAGGEA